MQRKKERNKDRQLRQMKKKNELPQVGFEPTTLCTPDRCSYQLSMYMYIYMYIIIIILGKTYSQLSRCVTSYYRYWLLSTDA